MKEILKQATKEYGVDMQLDIAIEEFSELTKEICKYRRGADNIENIIEEVADCYIMLKQIELIFGLNDIVLNKAMNGKIDRLKVRLAQND